ncbi:MAG: hypothetical protein AB2535_20725 [Candidatus Thiodiazotropha endolucinida]
MIKDKIMPSSLNNTSNASDKMELGNRNLNVIQIAKERNVMAFVNEFASDEDIEKYDLNGIWDQYHPLRKGKYYLGQRPWFTIDRDQNIFFMVLGSGREEQCNRKKILLWIDGYQVVVEIELAKGSSPNTNDQPFKRIWGLIGVHPQEGVSKTQKEIINILKEALIVYGYFGVHHQVSNTIVKFNF